MATEHQLLPCHECGHPGYRHTEEGGCTVEVHDRGCPCDLVYDAPEQSH